MVNGISEIDDERFFFAKDGKINAQSELNATIEALLNDSSADDESAACRFPARKAWLEKELNIAQFPQTECKEYEKVLKRLNPKSVTMIFPSAHINSPASMFGHTFLRINSAYDSKLLSYAVNYAADADPDKENAIFFAIKGLFDGYFGKYSLLPYYDKLKEYRDSEQRDIWEYNLDLTQDETLKMFRHIWELNDTRSYYYFFTENCSYNMLWFLEVARDEIHLRDYFGYQIIPLETIHALKDQGVIESSFYRPSKRTTLLKYEEVIEKKYINLPLLLVEKEIHCEDVTLHRDIKIAQKRYILEASIELLEYKFSKNKIKKEEYLELFYALSRARAALGQDQKVEVSTPENPIDSHQSIRVSLGGGQRDGSSIGFLGIRPAYHDLQDSSYGFLRATQIEFLDLELSYFNERVEIEKATILSIVSLAQRSQFFQNLSWRTKFGWDRNSPKEDSNFMGTVGAGLSWGNEMAYLYMMVDPLFYINDGCKTAIGTSFGIVFDKYNYMSTMLELTKRYYSGGFEQYLREVAETFRVSRNIQLELKYDYEERNEIQKRENGASFYINYYF